MRKSSERWLPVPGYEGYYEVSDQGRVRSLDRWTNGKGGSRQLRRGKMLRQFPSGDYGYLCVNLSVAATMQLRRVHSLVLEAFVGPRPPGMVTCHGPNGRLDNQLNNLRYGTYVDNAQDCIQDGTHVEVRKVACPLGHELRAPNLEVSTKRRNQDHRSCYACSLTRIWARHRGYVANDTEWAAEADRRYAEILHFGKPIDYRLSAIRKKYGEARWRPPAN